MLQIVMQLKNIEIKTNNLFRKVQIIFSWSLKSLRYYLNLINFVERQKVTINSITKLLTCL